MKEALDGMEPTMLDDAMLGGAGCDSDKRRPDFLYHQVRDGVNIIVSHEVDEDGGHPDRPAACDAAKLFDEFQSLQKLLGAETRVFFIRYNPDEYDGDRVTLKERIETVANLTKRLFAGEWRQYDPLSPHVFYYYYHSKAQFHIDYMRSKLETFRVYVPVE